MPKLELNGKESEVFSEELLLGAARREKAHIGFACGGHGLCQTCEVTILEGADALSPINDIEKAWLTSEKQSKGHRLACQARVIKDHKIKLLTRAEAARNVFNRAFKEQPKEPSQHPQGYPGEFFTWLGLETIAHLQGAPGAIVIGAKRLLNGELKLNALTDSFNAVNERFPEIQEIVSKTAGEVPKLVEGLPKFVSELSKNWEPALNSAMELTKSITDSVGAAVGEVTKSVSTVVSDSTKQLTATTSTQPKAVPVEIKKK